MAQARDIETLRRAERNILCGLGFALLLFLIYAWTSTNIQPPIKGLPKPTMVYTHQATVRTYYTLDAADREAWNSLDIKLQIYGYKRYQNSYAWLYRNARGERVSLTLGAYSPGLGVIDMRVPGKLTLIHTVPNRSWKMLWMRFVWGWQARQQMRAASASRSP